MECDVCEFNAKSESEMRFYLKNVHSARDSNLKWLDCDFCAYNEVYIQSRFTKVDSMEMVLSVGCVILKQIHLKH